MKIFNLFFICLFLCSCEYGNIYTYIIENKTEKTLRVYYNIDHKFPNSLDSLDVLPQDTCHIFIKKGMNAVRDENENISYYFKQLDIYTIENNNLLKSKKDYLSKSNWIFNKKSTYEAEYRIFVEEKDF